ncbi:MAG: hypothetical protein ACREN2_05385 [Candidatus Dormibacteria bacterium]
MLRQIARLGRAVPFAGPGALAIAVYADTLNEPIAAREAGYEGVACVDDAARALQLYCDLWEVTRLSWALLWCNGLLEFLLAMQGADGRWLNFILDWEGAPNVRGRTSVAGGAFWQARALLALAHASRVLSDARIADALRRGLPHIIEAVGVPADVRVLHIRTALTLLQGTDDGDLTARLSTWSDELLSCRVDGMLMNSQEERGHPHLWGHIQEGVLADAGVRLGRDDLVAAATGSAELVFTKVVDAAFDLPRVQPYDVASTVYALTRLAEVTGVTRYAALATAARSWFDGRNAAGVAVYDRSAGRVGDGVDEGCVNTNSGAEANIVGAQALFDEATTVARHIGNVDALPTIPS